MCVWSRVSWCFHAPAPPTSVVCVMRSYDSRKEKSLAGEAFNTHSAPRFEIRAHTHPLAAAHHNQYQPYSRNPPGTSPPTLPTHVSLSRLRLEGSVLCRMASVFRVERASGEAKQRCASSLHSLRLRSCGRVKIYHSQACINYPEVHRQECWMANVLFVGVFLTFISSCGGGVIWPKS